MWLPIILIIIVSLGVFAGLIYLWDYYACENMHKSTIAVLSIITIVILGILAWFIAFVCNDFSISFMQPFIDWLLNKQFVLPSVSE